MQRGYEQPPLAPAAHPEPPGGHTRPPADRTARTERRRALPQPHPRPLRPRRGRIPRLQGR